MKWEAKLIVHRKESRIGMYFEKNSQLIERMKKLDGARWSQSKKVWHLPDTPENRERFKIIVPQQQVSSAEGMVHLEKFEQWLRSKRYSENTIKTYKDALKSFLVFYHQKEVGAITNEDVVLYNTNYILKKQPFGILPKPDCKCSQTLLQDGSRQEN